MGDGCIAVPICDLGAVRVGWPMPHPGSLHPGKRSSTHCEGD
jgi:hypothetical protein